jgi:glycerophosphoryl diester phosphodiesterase
MLAREQNAPWVEIDAKITLDGVPILMHDDTLDRTTNGRGKVADKMWAEIKNLDAGGWFGERFKGERVPHLAEALRVVIDSRMQLILEIKPCAGRGKVTAMVTLIETTKWWPADRAPPLLLSFSEEALVTAMQLQPQWPRGFSLDKWEDDWRGTAARLQAQVLTVNAELINQETMRALKETGLAVLAYTVDDPLRAKELLRLGVSAVFCNNPNGMLKAL